MGKGADQGLQQADVLLRHRFARGGQGMHRPWRQRYGLHRFGQGEPGAGTPLAAARVDAMQRVDHREP